LGGELCWVVLFGVAGEGRHCEKWLILGIWYLVRGPSRVGVM
jgi:hypothetical protein